MKNILNITGLLALAGALAVNVSCDDFLTTVPKDALSPATTWKTQADAQAFLIGIYNNWSGMEPMYFDSASDFGFNYHVHEGKRNIGNGNMTSAYSQVSNYYGYNNIRRCNEFFANVGTVAFESETIGKNIIAQVRIIRAWKYFELCFMHGGVPIIDTYASGAEAQVPRKTEANVIKYVYDEIDAAIPDLAEMPSAKGYWAKGAALALKVRSALYWSDYQRAVDGAQALMTMGKYSLDPSFANLFTVVGQNSPEIILAYQRVEKLAGTDAPGQFYNNGEGGWSSAVPTQNLVDAYEMANGLTRGEAGSDYDPAHPFAGRDPRMAMTVVFPGADHAGKVFNTLDLQIGGANNPNFPTAADNASKTGLTWGKYLLPYGQYADIWSTGCSPIHFRYAEVLLSFAEAKNELSGPAADVYDAIDLVRGRVGMPKVDRVKYAAKETLRELIRRERGVELAGEGLRRADILRWKDASGKMVAETVLNGPLNRITGTVDTSIVDPYMRAVVDPAKVELIEQRIFKPNMRYLPIPQSSIDNNPQLIQNEGY